MLVRQWHHLDFGVFSRESYVLLCSVFCAWLDRPSAQRVGRLGSGPPSGPVRAIFQPVACHQQQTRTNESVAISYPSMVPSDDARAGPRLVIPGCPIRLHFSSCRAVHQQRLSRSQVRAIVLVHGLRRQARIAGTGKEAIGACRRDDPWQCRQYAAGDATMAHRRSSDKKAYGEAALRTTGATSGSPAGKIAAVNHASRHFSCSWVIQLHSHDSVGVRVFGSWHGHQALYSKPIDRRHGSRRLDRVHQPRIRRSLGAHGDKQRLSNECDKV